MNAVSRELWAASEAALSAAATNRDRAAYDAAYAAYIADRADAAEWREEWGAWDYGNLAAARQLAEEAVE